MSSSDRVVEMSVPRLRVGYVLKRFPRLSETFVLNEILELERQGVEVEIFSLKRALDEPRNRLLADLRARVTYVSGGRARDGETDAGPDAGSDAGPDIDGLSPDDAGLLADLAPGKDAAERTALAQKAIAIGRLARARGVQHLHAHFASDAATAALVASRIGGMPFSFTAHARDIFHCYVSREVDDRARRIKIDAARFVATVSDYNRSHLHALAGGRGRANVVRLYNGIDLARFAPAADVARSRGAILCVGRLVEKKGLADLVEACGILRDRGIAFTCEIVGDGPLRPALEARIAAANLVGRVTLRGALPHHEVREMMHRAGMMVLPCVVSPSGDQDGLPTVLLEALGVGLPAISTRVAGVPEIIVDNVTGLLVEPAAPLHLAAAMTRLLDDHRLADRLAVAGRAHARRHFDLGGNVAELHRLFLRAIASPSHYSEARDAHRLSVR